MILTNKTHCMVASPRKQCGHAKSLLSNQARHPVGMGDMAIVGFPLNPFMGFARCAMYNAPMPKTLKDRFVKRLAQSAGMAGDILLEALFPTRCAVCDEYCGEVLCKKCENSLSYIDACRACASCGSPFGIVQCTECNDLSLAALGLESLPTRNIASALILDEASRRIVTIYKDSDERRLVNKMAQIMGRYIPPECMDEDATITYIPDSEDAYRRRGFDHGLEIAQALSGASNLRYARLFERPKSKDQRKLGKKDRIANMRESISLGRDAGIPESILIVDDVFTTGATLLSAASMLKDAGAESIRALTFARTFGNIEN